MLHVALYQPMIPPNTGATARQCVGMNAHLHLVGPHRLDLSDHAVKRAGLDYWPHLILTKHPTPDDFVDWLARENKSPWLVTKLGEHRYDRAPYADEDVLVFGNEKEGIPQAWHDRWPDRRISVPILGQIRSYNLANTVAIVLAQATSTAALYPPPHP
ncbi:TrmH family RNA methyltransferase [Phycisphaerales bacterium AB-hyl4]|uniref:Putative tRNA (cytidine(34)-2'-O)-methyltransferase n=1 Tax=Natronomicrosphaera hydrolytica TaxID=3242702 RepID=A0ABV4UAQ8_9BACT